MPKTKTQDSPRQFTWAFWAFAFALLLVAAELARNYQIGALQIRVEGNLSPDEREQLDALLGPHVRASAFRLDSEDLAKDLGSLPWVGAVEISSTGLREATVKVSHSLTTRLSRPERTLVNAIRDLAGANENTPVALSRDALHADAREKFVFKAFEVMLDELGIRLDEFQIEASGQIVLHMDAGKTLMLGREDPVARMRTFARVHRFGLAEHWHEIAHIDARYRDAVAVKRLSPGQPGQLIAGNFPSTPAARGEGR